jgi:hypothetical protein
VRSAPTSWSTSPGDKILGSPRHRTNATVRDRPVSRRAAVDSLARHRIHPHRSVTTRDQIRVETRNRRQPTRDRARRQARLAIGQPHHLTDHHAGAQGTEHVGSHDAHRILRDHREERLQIEGHRP